MSTKADSVRLYKVRKLISELASKEGRGTELVSLYVPPKKPVHEVIANLREEWGTAGNIKSDTTRNHVQDALTRTMQRLKLYRTTPDNGLVIFCGALPTNGPGSEVINLNEIVPPKPVISYLYACDDHFHIDGLKDMLREEKVYGILAIDASEAGLGILSGDTLEIPDVITSGISGKTRKGGQCVSADTLVQTEDGRLVPVSSVTPGSKVASYNFQNFAAGTYEIADRFTLVPKAFYEVITERPMMRVLATGEHRFFTLSGKDVVTVEASRLKPGLGILVTRRLPEPIDPVFDTQFPAEFRHSTSAEGRRFLKDSRLGKSLSQKAVADALGLHQTEISQLERGRRELSWEKLERIVRFLYPRHHEFLSSHVTITRTTPAYFTMDLLQLLGYISGDGHADGNRVVLSEDRVGVAKVYVRLARQALDLEYVPIKKVNGKGHRGSFARRDYYETRIYSKAFVDALRLCCLGLISADDNREIPERIHRLDNAHLARFLRGLFDAEAHARKGRGIGIAMKSGLMIKQVQLLLLRFGIVSSYSTYVNRYGSTMHGLDISDYDSLDTFHHQIGFSARDKRERVRRGLGERRAHSHSYLNIPVVGSWVDKRAKSLGIRRRQFRGITNFFHDERGISWRVFRRVVETFEDELTLAKNSDAPAAKVQLLQQTVERLRALERSELIMAKVKEVRVVRNGTKKKFVDLELPASRSFFGNGFVLHNSARRYERGREMELTYYYHRIAEHATRVFVEGAKVTGLVVGGPGPTKDDFLKGDFLHYELQKKVLAVIDLGYSGREGVRELVEKASEVLKDVRLVEEKKLVQKFLSEVNKAGGLAVYGLPRVLDALQKANVEVVLVSDDLNTVRIEAKCKKCGTVQTETASGTAKVQKKQELISGPCRSCGATEFEVSEKDVVDVLEEMAFQVGARVEVISSGTEEGNMFKTFGGVAAILRYRTS